MTTQQTQIRVHIIEARSLKGTDSSKGFSLNPTAMVELTAGDGGPKFPPQYLRHEKECNSVFWDEVKVFQEELTRDQYNNAKITLTVQDSALFGNRTIGTAHFDLPFVYDHPFHEIYGKWVPLLDENKSGLQGMVRLSITVLREGDQPKIHVPSDLDDDNEPTDDLVKQLDVPRLQLDAYLLTVRINKVELAPYGLDKPSMQVRVRFASQEVRTERARSAGFNVDFNEELRMPVYTPTMTDRIRVDILDTRHPLGVKLICSYDLSFEEVRSEELETQWHNMYGVRPPPKQNVLSAMTMEREDDSGEESAYRGRILLYAHAEMPKEELEARSTMKLPKVYTKAEQEALIPPESLYALRCDLYDAADIPASVFDKVYVVCALGPIERHSPRCSVDDGVVCFESAEPGLENYYEQVEDIKVKMPDGVNREQHYDVFLHVYVATALGERRIGYLRYSTEELDISRVEEGTPLSTPKWVLLNPDPTLRDEMAQSSAMLQFSLIFGPQKHVSSQPRRRSRILKKKTYELKANIFQATGLLAADANGLSDPYVRVCLAGTVGTTAIIPKSLNPIWYEPLSLKVQLPSNLDYAPKATIAVFDSDAAPLNLAMLKEATREMTDTMIGRALAPAGSYEINVKQYYNQSCDPMWIELYEPRDNRLVESPNFDPRAADAPKPCGRILCSFELKPFHPSRSEASETEAASLTEITIGGEDGASQKVHIPKGVKELRPRMKQYVVELSVVGCRDVPPRDMMGFSVALTSPYVEFEYGDQHAEENQWRVPRSGAVAVQSAVRGADINILETIYIKVELPENPHLYTPLMGVRVREGNKGILPPMFNDDPIMGVTAINLLEHMEGVQQQEQQHDARELNRRKREQEIESARQHSEQQQSRSWTDFEFDVILDERNVDKQDEISFTSATRHSTISRRGQLLREQQVDPGFGERTLAEPELTELMLEDDGNELGEEDVGNLDDEIYVGCLEDSFEPEDRPFQLYALSHQAAETTSETQRRDFWKEAGKQLHRLTNHAFFSQKPVKSTGFLKMNVRVIEQAKAEEFLQQNKRAALKKTYAEKRWHVRVFVYKAFNLRPRPNGEYPSPFLKVYNREGNERTTRDIPLAQTLDPDFYQSFELIALLPGQSRLHIEVWDFQLLQESLLGETIIDLEDRLFCEGWQNKQREDKLPRERRPLLNPGNANPQGSIEVKVDILDKKAAIASPMINIEPPHTDMFELRVVVWEAFDVKAKDDAYFGQGGTSDVFVTIRPIGSQRYEMKKTDTHWFSTGDAEFNFRMTWPIALPDQTEPRLFVQLWDADLISANDAIGEAQLTLKSLCEKAVRRGGRVSREKVVVHTKHANFGDEVQGSIILDIELLPRGEAIQKPAGQGREKPNQHPYLPEPVRPTFYDGLGIDFNRINPVFYVKKYFACICACLILVAIVVGVIFINYITP